MKALTAIGILNEGLGSVPKPSWVKRWIFMEGICTSCRSPAIVLSIESHPTETEFVGKVGEIQIMDLPAAFQHVQLILDEMQDSRFVNDVEENWRLLHAPRTSMQLNIQVPIGTEELFSKLLKLKPRELGDLMVSLAHVVNSPEDQSADDNDEPDPFVGPEDPLNNENLLRKGQRSPTPDQKLEDLLGELPPIYREYYYELLERKKGTKQ